MGRLSVRSAAAVAALIDDDERCGFASDSVEQVIDGGPGGSGTVTLRVTACELDLGSAPAEDEEPKGGALVGIDCAGTETRAWGKVTVSAHKVLSGHLTGASALPLVPEGSTSATIVLDEVKADGFVVFDSKSQARFTMDAAFSAAIRPVLFADDTTGLCTVPSRNAVIKKLRYQPDALVHVAADGRSFDVDVGGSDLTASAGKTDAGENTLTGSITVFGGEQTLDGALDPDYAPDTFVESWSCLAGLAPELSSSCSAAHSFGENGARLTLRTLGAIVKVIDADTACGFASADVLSRADVSGELGRDGGSVTYGIAQPCHLELPADLLLGTDCLDNETHATGGIEVTGTKRVVGWVTGDAATPIVPSSRDAVRFEIVANLADFRVEVTGQPSLTATEGLLSGVIEVRTAQDTTTGACSRPTPGARFTQVALGGGALSIGAASADIALDLDLSDVDAQAGPGVTAENTLSGTAMVDGETIALAAKLDPDYDAVDFQSGFICEEGLLIPLEDDDCTFHRPLAQLTARGVVDLIDAATSLLRSDAVCGLAASASATACALGPFDDVIASTDCTTETRASGSFIASAIRVDDPTAAAGTTITYSSLAFSAFTADVTRPSAEPPARLTLTGELTTAVDIASAERSDGAGAGTGVFDVPSPVRRYRDLSLTAEGALVVDGLTFFFTVDGAALSGVRGPLGELENELTGLVTVNGQQVEIPVDRRDRSLETDYDADAFLARYSCEAGFFAPVP